MHLMSSETDPVKAEDSSVELEDSDIESVELEDSELEEVAGGTEDAEQIAETSNQRYRR